MIGLIVGFVTTLAVMYFSLEGGLAAYFHFHSVLIVFGGTITILLFSTPFPVLSSLWRSIRGLFEKDETIMNYKDELAKLADNRDSVSPSANELIAYGQEMWVQGVDPDLFIVLISQKKKEIEARASDAVQCLKNLAKYPPALGMTGTVMGMIGLFGTLDNNKGNIGQSLSLAMTATFLGLIMTNAVISPLADRLHVKQINKHRMLDNIYEILLLINQGEPLSLIKEELKDRAA